ncbi:MAG TPA: cation diffusion facilitator family transporter [Candidatus Macondimonas sp.]|nr:cation diffusion facilitator family transporter [Candidatus Macondimonas sp.]
MTSHSHAHHGHAHDQGHAHHLNWATGLTLAFAAVEAGVGYWSNSLALLGDAGHMVTDAGALILATLAAHVARRPASVQHSYGFGRAEVVAALANSLIMLVLALALLAGAVQRLQHPAPVQGGAVLTVAAVGLAFNLVVLALLLRGQQTLNIRAAILHVLGDALGSIAALTSGAIILATGWMRIDPLLTLVICGLLLVGSVRVLREGLHVVMEGVPCHLDLDTVGRALASTPGVRGIHDLHIWTLSSGHIALSAHVDLDTLEEWSGLLGRLRHLLSERFDIHHVTLQPEPQAWTLRRMPYDPARRAPPHARAQRSPPDPQREVLDEHGHPH